MSTRKQYKTNLPLTKQYKTNLPLTTVTALWSSTDSHIEFAKKRVFNNDKIRNTINQCKSNLNLYGKGKRGLFKNP